MDVRLAGRVRRCHHSPVPPQLPEVTGKPLRDNAFPSRRHHIAALRGGRWLLLGLAVALALPLPGAAQTTRETERKLQKLRTELKGVAQERRQIEGQRGQASQQLREADEKWHAPAARLRRPKRARRPRPWPRPSSAAAACKPTWPSSTANWPACCARRISNHAPLKLLLSQDTVADANRALAYHRYLQRERAQRITTLTADLKELEALQAQIAERKQKLQGAQDQKQQAAALAADRRDRAQTVASLDERFRTGARRNRHWARMPRRWKRCWPICVPLPPGPKRRAAARRAAAEKAAAERAARQAAHRAGHRRKSRFHLRWRRHRHRRSAAWAGRCPATCWPAMAASCPMAVPAAAC